jgi:hypothetical protein
MDGFMSRQLRSAELVPAEVVLRRVTLLEVAMSLYSA